MSDYISREALTEAFENADADVCESFPDGYCDWGFGRQNIRDVIASVPTADVEPVVRCKDCKHLRVWNQKDIYAFCPKTNIVFLPFEKDTRTFFCSLGEAKMNGGIENASKEM